MSSKTIHFRFLPEGTGGSFTFSGEDAQNSDSANQNLDHIDHIGTYGCYTCVGLYFKLDDRRGCCLHVNGQSRVMFPKNLVSESDGDHIKLRFIESLEEEAKNSNWDVKDPEFGKDMFIICPNPDIETLKKEVYHRAGWYVVEGLREWLQGQAQILIWKAAHLKEAERTPLQSRIQFLHQVALGMKPDTKQQGFVVHHATGQVHFFNVPDDRPLSDWDTSENFLHFRGHEEPGLQSGRHSLWSIHSRIYDQASRKLGDQLNAKIGHQIRDGI